MFTDQPSTSKAALSNANANMQPKLRYECQHLKEVRQLKASLAQLKADYGNVLIKTTDLIKKLTDLEEKVNILEGKNRNS